MPIVRSFLALALLGAGTVFAAEDMPADLRAYIEQIKAAGMTEEAAGSLRTVAALETGASILEIKTDESGRISSRGYTASLCPKPGMSEEAKAELQRQIQEMNARIDREMERFKPLADRDGSGFVSSGEGSRFRQLYELGKSVLVVTADGVLDGERVAERLRMPADKLRDDVAAYAAIKSFAPLPELKFPSTR